MAVGGGGERRIPIASFFTGPFSTALQPDEILVEIRMPISPPRSGGAYVKIERKVGDFATAAVAVQLTLAADGTCAQVGIGLTNVGPMPIKAERGGGRAPRQAAGRGRPSSGRPSSPRTRRSPPPTCADRSSTRRTWCGC